MAAGVAQEISEQGSTVFLLFSHVPKSMIKVLFWNVKGLRKAVTIKRSRKLKKLYDFTCLTICEPLLDVSNLLLFRGKLGFQ